MIYCDKCYKCSKRLEIEKEEKKAKDFYCKYGARYIFECGAYYLPVMTNIKEICDYDFQEIHCGCQPIHPLLFPGFEKFNFEKFYK